MRYLVGLGEDDATHTKNKALMGVAMHHAVPGRDCLLLVRVVEELKPDSAIVLLDMLCDDVAQIKLEADTKKKLEVYNTECRDAGLDSALLVLSNDHPGVALCEAAKNHKADCIIVGRRDLGTFKRLITFSTSKYCIDNADCNVIIVKRPYSEGEEVLSHAQQQKAKELSQAEKDAQGQTISSSSSFSSSSSLEKQIPSQRIFTLRDPEEMKRSFERAEQHKQKDTTKPKEPSDWKHESLEDKRASLADLVLTKEMEEKERKERIRERNSGEEREQTLRRQESKKDLILVRKLEEEERNRRMSEWGDQAQPSKTEIKKSLADTKILEETARQEKILALNFDDLQENEKMKLERTKSLEKIRIAEEQERQERIHSHQRQTSCSNRPKAETEKVKKLEDDEQARRIRGEQKLQRIRSKESQLDLQKVKEMEEIERGRRIESMRISQ